jgi:hypothetical protein
MVSPMRTLIQASAARVRALGVAAGIAALTITGFAASKGPDGGGYTASDETAYSLIDATQGGAGILSGIDDGTAVLTLPFAFEFYGQSYQSVCVSTNGALYFGTDQAGCAAVADFASDDLANTVTAGDKPGLFPFWTDLTFDAQGAGSVYYKISGDAPNRQFIVEWSNAFALGAVSPITFEAILFEGSNQVLFQYKTVAAAANGRKTAVGIRGGNALETSKVLPWSWDAPVIADNSAIIFIGERATPTVVVTGGTFTYNGAPRPGSGYAHGAVGAGDLLEPAVTLSYAGTGSTVYAETSAAPTDVGTYTVKAFFIGNALYGTAQNTAALAITQASQTILFTSTSPASPVVGGPTYLVAATGGASGNAVTFSSLTPTACAVNTATVSFIAPGACQVAADQGASTNYSAAAQVTQQMTVQPAGAAATTTLFTSAANPSSFGASVTFTATVRRNSDSVAVSGGTVTFKEGAVTLAGPTAVNGGQASFSTASLTVGSHTVMAVYTGNASFANSDATVVQVVNKAVTTLTMTTSASPAQFSDPVTFTATVTVAGVPVAGGIVNFHNRSTALATNVPINAQGKATFTTPALAVGTHPISATYKGTSTLADTQHEISQIVQPATTTTSLTSSPNPSNRNQAVTFTATVKHNAAGVPSGTVTFKEGATVLAANVAVNASGIATFQRSNLTSGTHAITAVYNPTASYGASTGLVSHRVR